MSDKWKRWKRRTRKWRKLYDGLELHHYREYRDLDMQYASLLAWQRGVREALTNYERDPEAASALYNCILRSRSNAPGHEWFFGDIVEIQLRGFGPSPEDAISIAQKEVKP